MERPSRSWWRTLLRGTRTMVLIVLGGAITQQMCAPMRLAAAREDLLDRLQQERRSRAIAMIHRHETVSLFGVPVASSIGIADSEAVLRATPSPQAISPSISSFTPQAGSCSPPNRLRWRCSSARGKSRCSYRITP